MKAVALALVLTPLLPAQWLDHPTPGIPRTADGKPNLTAPAPRTADGTPDLSGIWDVISPRYGNNIAADLKPEDVQPWAQALVRQRTENLGKDYMHVLCLPLGPGYSTNQRMMKIVQTPTLIVMLDEDLTYRQIFLDGRALETNPSPSWMGYSVGRWERDTLVVDSFGFNDRTWLDHDGHPHTEALRMTERYRRTDFWHLEVQITLQDPTVYSKPWTVALSAQFAPDTELLEAFCNENNTGLDHLVGTASDDRKSAVKVASEILAKYAGSYVEQPKFWRSTPRTIEIVFTADGLVGDLDGRGSVPLIPQSETIFSGFSGLSVEFVKDGLLLKHVSGDYKFARTK